MSPLEQIDKVGFIKIQSFGSSKSLKRTKRQATQRRKHLEITECQEGFVSLKFKDFSVQTLKQLNV